jgi:Holliday junction resolvase RusA-like endonuclease
MRTPELVPATALWDTADDCDQYTIVVLGPPASMLHPTSIAWMSKGKMRKAAYNSKSKKVIVFCDECKLQMTKQGATTFPIHDKNAVAINIYFYCKVPKISLTNVKSHSQANHKHYDLKKPDIDNMSKFVLNALTGVFYKDDKQVVKLTAVKIMDCKGPHGGCTVIHCYGIGDSNNKR